jgi:uncharacterized protein (DUF362 family)
LEKKLGTIHDILVSEVDSPTAFPTRSSWEAFIAVSSINDGWLRKLAVSVSREIVTCAKDRAYDILPELLSKAGFKPREYGLVLVKPNVCGMYFPSPRLLESTLRFFEPLAERIVVGETDSAIHSPEREFERQGISDLLKGFDGRVEARNLVRDEILKLVVPSPHAVSPLPIPKMVDGCDLLVNLPKIGTHSNTKLTCSLKNLFGLLAEKRKYAVYHPRGVDNVIADLAKIVRCDLNIVDAGDEVIVGVNPLSVDIHACKYVGLDPLKVKHLRLVAEDRGSRLEDEIAQLRLTEL